MWSCIDCNRKVRLRWLQQKPALQEKIRKSPTMCLLVKNLLQHVEQEKYENMKRFRSEIVLLGMFSVKCSLQKRNCSSRNVQRKMFVRSGLHYGWLIRMERLGGRIRVANCGWSGCELRMERADRDQLAACEQRRDGFVDSKFANCELRMKQAKRKR